MKKPPSKKKEVQKLVQQLHNNSFDKGISNTISEAFEKKVNNILNKAIAEAGKIGGKSLDPRKQNDEYDFVVVRVRLLILLR